MSRVLRGSAGATICTYKDNLVSPICRIFFCRIQFFSKTVCCLLENFKTYLTFSNTIFFFLHKWSTVILQETKIDNINSLKDLKASLKYPYYLLILIYYDFQRIGPWPILS